MTQLAKIMALEAHARLREQWYRVAESLAVEAIEEGASVGQVARALGVTKPTLYAHCPRVRGLSSHYYPGKS